MTKTASIAAGPRPCCMVLNDLRSQPDRGQEMIPGLSLTHPHVNRGASVRNVAQIWLRGSTKGTSGRYVRTWVSVGYSGKHRSGEEQSPERGSSGLEGGSKAPAGRCPARHAQRAEHARGILVCVPQSWCSAVSASCSRR